MKKDQQTFYVSPQVKAVEVKARAIICQSGLTEGFTVNNDNTITDSDWE